MSMTVAVQEKQQIDVFANENGSVTIEQFDWNGGENLNLTPAIITSE